MGRYTHERCLRLHDIELLLLGLPYRFSILRELEETETLAGLVLDLASRDGRSLDARDGGGSAEEGRGEKHVSDCGPGERGEIHSDRGEGVLYMPRETDYIWATVDGRKRRVVAVSWEMNMTHQTHKPCNIEARAPFGSHRDTVACEHPMPSQSTCASR